MMSDKTKKYFDARIREGPDFNYSRWLKLVGEEDGRENNGSSVCDRHCDAVAAAGSAVTPKVSDSADDNLKPLSRPVIGADASRTNFRLFKSESSECRLTRRIERVRDAWKAFQSSRARDAVYDYLAAAFSLVARYKKRCGSGRAFRQAFRETGIALDREADAYSAIIRCTCAGALDRKTISKWARALRYVSYSDVENDQLKRFMKDTGGINACAAQYAKSFRRGKRSED